jgi:hypothetical protein
MRKSELSPSGCFAAFDVDNGPVILSKYFQALLQICRKTDRRCGGSKRPVMRHRVHDIGNAWQARIFLR